MVKKILLWNLMIFMAVFAFAEGEEKAAIQSIFKSPQAEAAYMAAYDRALEGWPVPYETKYVSTSYGDTHMIVSGPVDGEPIIVLHGGDGDATGMSPIISGLAQSYRVYALDTIGYAGKSRALKGIEDRAGVAEWLTGVLDELNIEKAHMVGWSMGGFLTVNYALEKPERLKKIVLLAPAATFVPFSEEWHFRVTLPSVVATLAINEYDIRRSLSYALEGSCQMFGVTKEELAEDDEDVAELMLNFEEESLKELEERINSVLKRAKEYMYVPGNLDDEFIAQFVPADWLRIRTLKSPKLWRFDPRVLPEEDIKNLKTPTLLLIGDQEVVYEADQTLARAEELVENIQTALIPNCSHMLAYEQTELVNSHILDFLSGDK